MVLSLSPSQRARYARHVLLPEVGERGQHALLDARVRVSGVGRAAEEAALYLAAAGIGTLVIAPALGLDARIAAMNPDVRLAHDGDGLVVHAAGDRRADGARVALEALLTIIGLTETT